MKNLKPQNQDNSSLEKNKHKSQSVTWTNEIYKPEMVAAHLLL